MRVVDLPIPNQVNDKNQRWLAALLILSSPGATSLLGHHVIVFNLISVQLTKPFRKPRTVHPKHMS